MPFTFSHPFIVLPLCRNSNRYFSATGLITGSMALDFEYFIYMKKIEHESFHTLPYGVFIFGMPAGFMLMFVYHLLIRNNLIDNLPPFLWRRLVQYKALDWNTFFKKNFIKITISLLVGIYSHLLLDAFTHDFGFFVRSFPALNMRVIFLNSETPVYDLLQSLLSFLGGIIIVYAVYKIKPVSLPPRQNSYFFRYWSGLGAVFCIVMLIRFLADTHHNKPVDILIAGIASWLIAIFLCSLFIYATRLRIFFVRREQ